MDLKTVQLNERHVELGAKMVPFAGFSMPVQYSSVKDETLKVRKETGIFDVSHMGEFFVTGKEAIKFVDYIMTNDFAAADMLKAVYSPLCREDGTVVDDLIAYKMAAERVLICVNASNIEKDFEFLSKFAKNFDCKLENHSHKYSLIALQGPKSQEHLAALSIEEGLLSNFDYYSVKEVSNSSYGPLILARTGYTGEDGFEIFCLNENILELWNKLLEIGSTPCGLASRDVLRTEVGYPLYGHEINDEVTPLDSALKWTVKLDKGDFVSKAALLSAKPSLRLIKLSLEKGIPREGYDVLNDAEEVIGIVTSGTMSPCLEKGIALAHIKKSHFPENKSFSIKIRNKIYPATFHTKPFISGGHL